MMRRNVKYVIGISMLLAVLAVMLCGCRKVEVPDGAGNAIVFAGSTSSHVSSKSLYEPSNINTDGNAIVVNDRFIADDGTTYHYMKDVAVTYNGTSGTGSPTGWNSETTYYWPKGGRHEFMAYTTENHAGNTTTLKDAEESASYDFGNRTLRVPTSGTWTLNLDNQFDFMYASTERSMTEQNPTRTVDLNFKHLFAAAQFNIIDIANSATGEYASYITFYNATLSGFYDEGSAVIPFSGTPTLTLTGNSDGTPAGNYGSTLDADTKLVYNVPSNIFSNDLLFRPHDRAAFTDVEIEIKYTEHYYYDDFGPWNDEWRKQLHTAKLILSTSGFANNWRAGSRYIYNFYIKDNNISFEVKVVPWITDDVVLD